MKFFNNNKLYLLLLVVVFMIVQNTNPYGVVTAEEHHSEEEETTATHDDEEEGGEEAEVAEDHAVVTPEACNTICQEQILPYINDQATLQQEKESLMQQLEEATRQRDMIVKELQQVREELEKAHAATNEARALVDAGKEEVKGQYTNEIEALQKSNTLTKEEMAHYQKVAQDNQKYMQEYKNQLHSQRDKANKLSEALKEANLKIQELESTTFLKQLKKEMLMAWEAIKEYWTNLTNKGKSATDAEF